jgi:hypothetical protein
LPFRNKIAPKRHQIETKLHENGHRPARPEFNKGKLEMSKIVRNAILAIVAVSGLAGSAYAQQVTPNSCSNHDDYYSLCLGAANNGGHHDGRGDRR